MVSARVKNGAIRVVECEIDTVDELLPPLILDMSVWDDRLDAEVVAGVGSWARGVGAPSRKVSLGTTSF